jgi:hypothetical protein
MALQQPMGSIEAHRDLRRLKWLAAGLLLVGLGLWFFLMRYAGGLATVLVSLALRRELFVVGGSYFVLVVAKAFISVGVLVLCCVFFITGRRISGWLIAVSGFVVMLTFGGRGAAVAVLLGAGMCYHYLVRRFSLRALILATMLGLPLLMILGELRQSLAGGEMNLTVLESALIGDRLLALSYVFITFDVNVTFMERFVEDHLSFLGQYPLGITALLPREVYPDKANLLGSELAEQLYGIDNYGLSPSFTVGIMWYWGAFGLPFGAFLIGYVGAKFWRYCAVESKGRPLRLVAYASLWPVVPWLFFDFAGLLLTALPVLTVLLALRLLSRVRFKMNLPARAAA